MNSGFSALVRRHTAILGLVLGTGCSSSGADTTVDQAIAPPDGPSVELFVTNRAIANVVLFMAWDQGPRSRVGSLAAGATQTFIVPYGGELLTLDLDVPPSPPPVTAGPDYSTAGRILSDELRGGRTRGYSLSVEPHERLAVYVNQTSSGGAPTVSFARMR